VLWLGVLLAGCGGGGSSSSKSTSASVAPSAAISGAKASRAHHVRLVRIGNFDQPVYLTGAPGSPHRLFVVEKRGGIVVLDHGHRHTFLNITSKVNSSGAEQGLLSVVFAPDYARSGRFYVDYTDGSNNIHVVQYRRSADHPDQADSATARAVIRIRHQYANHNGGQLQFGPDGDLYVGVGDGGSEGDPHNYGQNTHVLVAKILRIRPKSGGGYSIPRGNPFVHKRGKRAEIWAYGLRNPWRFSFDRRSGDLIIGDVGQDREEEIDYARRGRGAGANYGWSIWEGALRYKPGVAPHALAPELVTKHSDGYCAIIGGYVVRDHGLPGLYGRYLYGDNCKSQISSVKLRPGRAIGNRSTGLHVSSLSAFGQDARGRVYAVSLNGPIYRLAG
jgi:glucose/arabinose dehydrogenase